MSLASKDTWYQDDSLASQPLPTHYVLKIKPIVNGMVERFKVRILESGNFQEYIGKYEQTHAPVASFASVRIFLKFILCLRMYIEQVEVKTAFLNEELSAAP